MHHDLLVGPLLDNVDVDEVVDDNVVFDVHDSRLAAPYQEQPLKKKKRKAVQEAEEGQQPAEAARSSAGASCC